MTITRWLYRLDWWLNDLETLLERFVDRVRDAA